MIDISMRRIVRKTKRHVMALTSMSSWYVSTPGAKMHLTAFFQGFDNFEELKCLIVKHALTVGKGNWIGMWAKNRLLDWFDSKGSWGWAVFNSVIQTLSHGRAHWHSHHTCKTDVGHKHWYLRIVVSFWVGAVVDRFPTSLACRSGLGTRLGLWRCCNSDKQASAHSKKVLIGPKRTLGLTSTHFFFTLHQRGKYR